MDATDWWSMRHGDDLTDALRNMTKAYPESVFIPGGTSADAQTADVMRQIAIPAILRAIEEIERLRRREAALLARVQQWDHFAR